MWRTWDLATSTACALQAPDDAPRLLGAVDADADENVRRFGARHAVVELGDAAARERLAEAAEAAAALGHGDRQHRLAVLAQLGLLGDEAQPVEIGVGARGDRHQGLAAQLALAAALFHPGLGAGDG
jgi:hypothetical protein